MCIRKTLGIQLGSFFHQLAIDAGSHALMLFKESGEMALGRKAQLIADVNQTLTFVREGVECKLHLENIRKHDWRKTGAAPKQFKKNASAKGPRFAPPWKCQ